MFDDLFALLKPDRLLQDPRATGAGVSIGLIDSGADLAILRAKHQDMVPIEGAVFRPDVATILPYTGQQSSPHGTTVADIILTLAPKAKVFSADVFGPSGTCEVDTLIRALHHAIDVWGCKIINLSLGVPEHRLQQLPKRLQFLRRSRRAITRTF